MSEAAKEFAIKAHGDQMYGDGEPYAWHLQDVVDVLREFGWGLENYIDAAWLHDTCEDAGVTAQDLRDAGFNDEVIEIALAVTNEPGKNRSERNAATYPKIVRKFGAVVVKLADRIANARACVKKGDSRLSMYRKEYPLFKTSLHGNASEMLAEMWKCLDALMEHSE